MDDQSAAKGLQGALESAIRELRLTEDPEQRNELLATILRLKAQLRAEEELVHSILDLPDELPESLSELSREELQPLLLRVETALRHIPAGELSAEAAERRSARVQSLTGQHRLLLAEIARRNEESYSPGPADAPAFEPQGYSAAPGMVKSRAENNDYYVESFRDHPWFPAISAAHFELQRLIPGYNIVQIKNKFGGLRYYFSYPEPIALSKDFPAYSSEDKIRAMAQRIVARAEGWVDGYEQAHRELTTED